MTYWVGKKVLIKGDAGFLGSHIVERSIPWGSSGRSLCPPELLILVSVCAVIVLLIGGLFYFKRMEQYFTDVV